MKVLAINTCPKKEKGKTALILDSFLEGMKEAGTRVESYYSKDLVIFPCCGNYNCTVRTPGKCMQYDDMSWLRPKISLADILVLASPGYCEGMYGPENASEQLKKFLEKLLPGAPMSTTGMDKGHALHPPYVEVNLRKIVIVSNCGFWELDNLYPVLTHIKAFLNNTFPEFYTCIPGMHGTMLRGMLNSGMHESEVIETSKDAGYRIIIENSQNAVNRENTIREQNTGKMLDMISRQRRRPDINGSKDGSLLDSALYTF